MKFILLITAFFFSSLYVSAQLKTTPTCPPIEVDVLEGTVNKLSSKSTLGEFKKMFPCFTEVVEEPDSSRCRGVFIKDKAISFFSDRNYFEIGEKFQGKLSMPLIGTNRSGLFKLLGYPKIKDVSWDAFQMVYGLLILYYNKAGNVEKIQISNKNAETLKLCEF